MRKAATVVLLIMALWSSEQVDLGEAQDSHEIHCVHMCFNPSALLDTTNIDDMR